MRHTLLASLPSSLSGARVLDAGGGTGVLAMDLARRGAEVVAIDLSPTLVEHAQELAHPALGVLEHAVLGAPVNLALWDWFLALRGY